jgi:hypothetical protein
VINYSPGSATSLIRVSFSFPFLTSPLPGTRTTLPWFSRYGNIEENIF